MKAYYSGSLNDKQPPGSVFAAKVPGCSITAYKSGKVLFQGSGCEIEAKKWGDIARSAQPSKKTSPAAAKLPENISSLSVIGSDEVGTGDYFGPITVVAAYVKKIKSLY